MKGRSWALWQLASASRGRAALLILRSIVCEMPVCCPKRVTAALRRNDFLRVGGIRGCRGWLSGGQTGRGPREGGVIEDRLTAPLGAWAHSIWFFGSVWKCLERALGWRLSPSSPGTISASHFSPSSDRFRGLWDT